MVFLEQNSFVFTLGAIIFLASMIFLVTFFVYRSKDILSLLKKIPLWFAFLNLVAFIYKISLPALFCSRNDFGLWLLSERTKGGGMFTSLMGDNAPVYSFIVNFFDFVLDGISFGFVSSFHAFLFFISVFYVYYIVFFLFKDKKSALLSSLLYLFSPILTIYSLTEDYTNPAIFFSLQSLFFVSFYKYKSDKIFFWMGVFSMILAIGSRPEYIFFLFIFLLFLWLAVNIQKKIYYLAGFVLALPHLIISINKYLKPDRFVHGERSGGLSVTGFLARRIDSLKSTFEGSLNAILDIYTLMGFLILAAIFGFFIAWKKYRYNLRSILFFLIYALFLFFYYCLLHREGMDHTFKYISALIFPLVVLSGFFLSFVYQRSRILLFVLMTALALYTLLLTSPFFFKNAFLESIRHDHEHHYHQYFSNPANIIREYKAYKELEHKNRYTLGEGEFDIDFTQDSLFITNGGRVYLGLVAFNEGVNEPLSKKELNQILMRNKDFEGSVYVAQGSIGFSGGYNDISGFSAIDPKDFENILMEHLELEERIISYYEEDHHVFLYKMSYK